MSIRAGYGNIVTSGLTFLYDTGDTTLSYLGEPTTNLLPSAGINSYPTSGNGWGTYNTNQYGSGTYFSIGTVSSVSNNIVTMSSAHSLRTYDVMQPQTTGGGVTAGTNYFIKRISSTQFSLHEYNSSQDGSQGYINPATGYHKVHDSIANDTRISINSSGFPTMWWGAPHLPNSGLVKELIVGGFDYYPGRKTDCMRQHITRDASDHMAYGVDATFTPNQPVTVSFWTRSVDSNAVGKSISYQNYTYGQTSPTSYSFGAVLGEVGVWTRQSYTFTSPNSVAISYWFNPGGPFTYDIANIQIEQKDHITAFVAGSRSATQSLVDIVGGRTLNVSNASFNSASQLIFDGTDDYVSGLDASFMNGATTGTFDAWIYTSSHTQGGAYSTIYNTIIGKASSPDNGFGFNSNGTLLLRLNTVNTSGTTAIPLNTWTHVAGAWNSSIVNLYVNGVLDSSNTTAGRTWESSVYPTQIGRVYSGSALGSFTGRIANLRVYTRALSSTEIAQNYNHYKKRFI